MADGPYNIKSNVIFVLRHTWVLHLACSSAEKKLVTLHLTLGLPLEIKLTDTIVDTKMLEEWTSCYVHSVSVTCASQVFAFPKKQPIN